MRKKYPFEFQLDRLLLFFAERGVKNAVLVNELTVHFPGEDIKKMLSILEHFKFVEPLSVQYNPGEAPTVFWHIRSITPAGVHFCQTSSFVENARREHKERRRFDFEFFKIGFDTVIAVIALFLSLFTLLFSLLK